MDSRTSGGSDDPNAVPDACRGTGGWDQTGSEESPREPIGGLPGRRQGRFDAPFYPFQPQLAWMQGSMLTVEFNVESATCDLVTAARIRIRGRPVPVFNRGWVFDVLYAYQDDKARPPGLTPGVRVYVSLQVAWWVRSDCRRQKADGNGWQQLAGSEPFCRTTGADLPPPQILATDPPLSDSMSL